MSIIKNEPVFPFAEGNYAKPHHIIVSGSEEEIGYDLLWFKVKDPEATSRARVVEMFHHHTGWSGDHGFDPVSPGGSITEKCMLPAHYIEQIVPFDQTWMYNNSNLAFAGHVLSVAGGKPFDTLVEEHILSPLGMNATSFNDSASPPEENFAWGHPPQRG